MKHVNVSIFVPHAGCPHMCSFCNQKSISGCSAQPDAGDVESAARSALRSSAHRAGEGEIAFFGGSFTAIDREYMKTLLGAAQPFIGGAGFKGIRISTRPDAVDEEVCDILRQYRVTSVELGAQSTDDRVLAMNRRGHSREDIFTASRLLKGRGFELGLQMMTGLYGGSDEESIKTAGDIISMRPATVRIYPTVVLENTELARLYRAGEYLPQSVEQAAGLCARLLEMFENERIKVIRLGLHSGGGVEQGFVAGAYHPAFGELCESRIYLQKIRAQLDGRPRGEYTVLVAARELSKAAGQKKSNLTALAQQGYICNVRPGEGLRPREVALL